MILIPAPPSPAAELRKEAPAAPWEDIFFESINELTALADIPPLRDKTLAKGDIELRVWSGFSKAPLKGVVLKKAGGSWQAIQLNKEYNQESKEWHAEKTALSLDNRGESLWAGLSQLGLLRLPDQSTIEKQRDIVIRNGKEHVSSARHVVLAM